MKILITGADGFVGRNLVATLRHTQQHELLLVDLDTPPEVLASFTQTCDFVYHLAGVNRPENPEDFMKGNFGFTSVILDLLVEAKNQSPILISSSIQAALDNPYGLSKKAGEDLIFEYGKKYDIPVFVYRLHNLFGKWSRPNYNSVVATFAYNISHNLPITINNPDTLLELCHIDDVINSFLEALENKDTKQETYCFVSPTTQITLGELAKKLTAFQKTRENLFLPSLESKFDRQLYGTYLSYLEPNDFGYDLKKNSDPRGWLAEFIKAPDFGQVFVSKTFTGITRGNHWHHTKAEKFLVIQGTGVIRFRNIFSSEVIEYPVDGEQPKVLDIPTGYTHNITNTGDDILITLFWSTEIFDPTRPDTHFMEV